MFSKLIQLFSYLTYIIRLAFKRHVGMYFLILASIISIMSEFLSIYIISLKSATDSISISGIPFSIAESQVPIIFICLLLFRFTSLFIIESLSVHYAKELQVYFTSETLRKILHTNLKSIEKKEIGHYNSFAGDEASNAAQVIISFLNILNNTVLIVAYFVLIILYSVDLLYFTMGVLIILGVIFLRIYQYTFHLSGLQTMMRRKTNSAFMDSLNGLRVIKAFSFEDHMADEYKNLSYQYLTINSNLIILSNLGKYLPLILVLLSFGVYYLLFIQNTHISTIGSAVASLFILLRLLNGIGSFASAFGKVIGELKGTMTLINFLKDQGPSEKIILLSENISTIKFKNVSFSYGKSAIFKNLNLTFTQGKSYAIVGQTGSGKSTLLDLMLDFNTPDHGEICINNIPTHALNEKSLANRILYIGQEPIIFNSTIKQNLEINKSYNDEELEKSLKTSSLQTTIESFDDGLNYLLNYRGTNISGGQKQRINIARALLRNPEVLILDESVNALDEKTRLIVVKNIISEFKNKILIFVTHDKEILSFVDEVIDLDVIKENHAINQ